MELILHSWEGIPEDQRACSPASVKGVITQGTPTSRLPLCWSFSAQPRKSSRKDKLRAMAFP